MEWPLWMSSCTSMQMSMTLARSFQSPQLLLAAIHYKLMNISWENNQSQSLFVMVYITTLTILEAVYRSAYSDFSECSWDGGVSVLLLLKKKLCQKKVHNLKTHKTNMYLLVYTLSTVVFCLMTILAAPISPLVENLTPSLVTEITTTHKKSQMDSNQLN